MLEIKNFLNNRRQENHLTYYSFDVLQRFPLKHGTFSRQGGISSAPFDSLNVGENTGDEPNNIAENLVRIEKTFPCERLIQAEQIHSTTIVFLDHSSPSIIPSCDALVTQTPDLLLMIKHADCQATIIYDPEHHALALIHAGWRGQAQNIYAKVIEAMKNQFYSNPKKLLIAISPSLGPDHAEFKNYKQELPSSFLPFKTNGNYFDLWQVAENQLRDQGVLKENIHIAQVCTYCNPSDFFSYRFNRTCGRNATIAMLE